MPDENSSEPVDLEKELRLALDNQTLGDQILGGGVQGDEKKAGDNDILN